MGVSLYTSPYGAPAPSRWEAPGSQFKSRATQTEMRFVGDDFIMVSAPTRTPPGSRRPSNECRDGSGFERTMAWLTSFFQ